MGLHWDLRRASDASMNRVKSFADRVRRTSFAIAGRLSGGGSVDGSLGSSSEGARDATLSSLDSGAPESRTVRDRGCCARWGARPGPPDAPERPRPPPPPSWTPIGTPPDSPASYDFESPDCDGVAALPAPDDRDDDTPEPVFEPSRAERSAAVAAFRPIDPAPRAEVPAPWREADSAAAREDAVDVADVDVSGWGRTVSGLVGDLDSGLVRAPGLGDLDDPVRFVESPDKAAELVGGAPGRS